MLVKALGGVLVLLATVHATGSEVIVEEEDPLFKCSETVRRLPIAQWELLREAVTIYENSTFPALLKILQLQSLLKNHSLPASSTAATELLTVFILTDYTHSVQNRTAEISQLMEIDLPSPYEDEDMRKIFETAISLPLMVVDKMFKELGKLKGPETAKMAQKTFRTLLFTEEYINADQENKKKLITRTVLCYAQSMGPDSGLALPIQMLNSTLQ